MAFADRILLNKTDLVTAEELTTIQTRLRSINGSVAVILTLKSVVDLDAILNIHSFDLKRILTTDPAFLVDVDHQHDSTITSVGISLDGPMNIHTFNAFIQGLLEKKGTDLFRLRGVLSIAGMQEKYVFQGVHMIFSGHWSSEVKMEGEANKFVFIGRNLDRVSLVEGFTACLAKPLRFGLEQRVQVSYKGGWKLGIIKAHWPEQGNVYRISVEGWDDVWAPEDIDVLVKELATPPL